MGARVSRKSLLLFSFLNCDRCGPTGGRNDGDDLARPRKRSTIYDFFFSPTKDK